MNIGVDIRCLMSPIRTGVAEYTYELLNALFAVDSVNHYFLFYNAHTNVQTVIPKWEPDNVSCLRTHWPNKLFNTTIKLLKLPRLDRIIVRHAKPAIKELDVFFSPNPYFTAVSRATKSVITVHDLSFELYPEFFTAKQRLVNLKRQCHEASRITVPSENTKRDIAALYHIDPKKIQVIYPGLSSQFVISSNKESVKKKYGLPDKFILFLGTIEPRKNIIGLIDAYEQVHSLIPDPHSLVIAGGRGWNDKEIYARHNASPLKKQIRFIGYVESADKPTLYSQASLFVYPSFYEGFGFPVIEAMASNVPVITSNRSSLPEITGGAAYLANPNNVASIANGMVHVLTNPGLAGILKTKGMMQAKKFAWKTAARQWLELIAPVKS